MSLKLCANYVSIKMSFIIKFLLTIGIITTEITIMIMTLMLIFVVMDTIFTTVLLIPCESMVMTDGFSTQTFLIIAINEIMEAPLCSIESDSV